MPFGLTNTPATFQSIMNVVFCPYLCRFVLFFFYDILVYSPSWKSHLEHLRIVLQLLASHQFFANQKKYSLGKTSIEYLSRIISAHSVVMDPSKISSVLQWPQAKTITAVGGVFGLNRLLLPAFYSQLWAD